jgi:hypothetical protein
MRFCLCLLAIAAGSLAAAEGHPGQPIRGKLSIRDGKPAILQTSDRKSIQLEGDETTMKVLGDSRLNGFDVEVHGRFTAPDRFQVDAAHTHSLLVRKDGKLKLVSYWCDVCSIRSFTPGPCVCCQKETTVELLDPGELDH